MSDFQELFGDLRSLMNQEKTDVDAIWKILEAMAKDSPDRFKAEVVEGYLPGFIARFPGPLHQCTSLEELEEACVLLPLSVFSLSLKAKEVGEEEIKALAESIHLRHLTTLELRRNNIGEEG